MFGGIGWKIMVMAKKGVAAAGPTETSAIFASGFDSPFINAYGWSSSGFGSKFSNPSSAPAFGAGRRVDVSPAGDVVLLTTNSLPGVHAWSWSSSGFGTKYADPATATTSNSCRVAKFSNNQNTVVLAFDGSGGKFWSYEWSSSGFGTRNSTLSLTNSNYFYGDLDFTSDDSSIVITKGDNDNWISAYTWSSSGFGTKFTDPSIPFDIGYGGYTTRCAFSPNNSHVIVGGFYNNSGYQSISGIAAWPWNNSTGFGTKYSDPSTNLDNGGPVTGIAFSKDSNFVFLTTDKQTHLQGYHWSSSGFGAKLSNPSSLPSSYSEVIGMGVSKTLNVVGIGGIESPYVHVWPFSSSGFGTKYSNPSTALPGWITDVNFN